MPLSQVRRRVLHLGAGPVLAVVFLLGAGGCGTTGAPAADQPQTGVPRGLQGPPLLPRVVQQDGTRVTCPTGAAPAVDLERAQFRPGLLGGTRLGRGSHRILVTGSVTNETNSPVQVLGLSVRVGGVRWPAAVSVPTRLAPGGAGRLVVRGTHHDRRVTPACVETALCWRWSIPRCAAAVGTGSWMTTR